MTGGECVIVECSRAFRMSTAASSSPSRLCGAKGLINDRPNAIHEAAYLSHALHLALYHLGSPNLVSIRERGGGFIENHDGI